jgi:hypothetical protein
MTEQPVAPPVDLAELRRLAEAATPGPWETNDPGIVIFSEWGGWLAEDGTENQEADAAYIAAASPDVILRLLDDLTRPRWHHDKTLSPEDRQYCDACDEQVMEVNRLRAELAALQAERPIE